MDRRGLGGWGLGSDQDQGGGSGRGSPSDACYESTAPQDPYDKDRPYYGTNNNDYSKYAGGSSEYLPRTADYNTFGSEGAGGYYDHHHSPGYRDSHTDSYSSDPHYQGHSDSTWTQYPGHHDSSDPGSSQYYNHPSDQEHEACNQSGCSDYSECSRQECLPSRVQVTAKVLFGSVNAISNLKQKKSTKKK